jgi:nucleoside-diphosphate-sugar epimerase
MKVSAKERMILAENQGVFLTGGTGFLGSHIGAELLRRGQKVWFLVRSGKKTSAEKRLARILDWHELDTKSRNNAVLVQGKLDCPDLGIKSGMNRLTQKRIDQIIHCASDTSFSARKSKQVWTANVESLQNLINFTAGIRCRRFIHLSTAYAAGRTNGPCKEEPVNARHFFNVYEESKAAAENYLRSQCRALGIELSIIRPSIVYGDSRTGRTLRFNALYYPVKTALFLKKIYREDIIKHGGKKAAAAGVKLEKDGTVRLPLRIEINNTGGVNLIPVDFFVKAFFAVTEADTDNGIHHIVSPEPTKIEDIIRYASSQFKLEGIRACNSEEFTNEPRNMLERLYERYLDAYLPYMRDKRIFLTDNTSPILEKCGITCPLFNEPIFRRCMTYAESQRWS